MWKNLKFIWEKADPKTYLMNLLIVCQNCGRNEPIFLKNLLNVGQIEKKDYSFFQKEYSKPYVLCWQQTESW